jgi:hydroxymethylpyrimidine/phosphomethylpyrimidine kinase
MLARVLVIAGSDSGGGAGIQADLKTVMALGGYAQTAITALTAQNTLGVQSVRPVPPDFIRAQIRAALDDIGADVIKTGMLGDAASIEAICAELPDLPLVVDPVMIAKGGASLLAQEALVILKTRLLPRATLLTPNLPEAQALTGRVIDSEATMRAALDDLLRLGARAVLLKGGHLPGDDLVDLLATGQGVQAWQSKRIPTRQTHGTGCTLASAIATGLAQGMTLEDAISRAREYVRRAILGAPGLGQGHGPLGHG